MELWACYFCLRDVADWLYARDLLDSNPIAELLLDGMVDEPESDEHYTVVVRSPTVHNACSYVKVKRVKKDSENSA